MVTKKYLQKPSLCCLIGLKSVQKHFNFFKELLTIIFTTKNNSQNTQNLCAFDLDKFWELVWLVKLGVYRN